MPTHDGGERELAPVIPLFGSDASSRPPAWNTSWVDDADDDDEEEQPADDGEDACASVERGVAEDILLRKLRTRSLSVAEARVIVRERDLDPDQIEDVLRVFVERGYLDDAKFAEQLVYSAAERKGQGRMAISQTLAKRGIPRELIDAALAELPDDERERALEFARSKARSMRGLDRDTALRRLSGQLARRGYGGQSLSAARQALDELNRPTKSGVRFEP